MTCAACQAHVQRALESVPGVRSVAVDLLGHRARISTDPPVDPSVLIAAVRSAGYDVPSQTVPLSRTAAPAEDLTGDSSTLLGWRAALSLIVGVAAMLLSMPLMTSASSQTAIDPVSR